VALALDATSRTIEAALDRQADLLITHHPLFFKPLKNLNSLAPATLKALKADLAVISAHTNWDQVGVAPALAETLGLIADGPLELASEALAKLTTYVPRVAAEDLKKALFQAGAGQQGDYSECAFELAGQGQFRPGPDSQPYRGVPGTLERTEEIRVETLLPVGLIPSVSAALRRAHPYEEPAFDFQVVQRPGPGLGLLAHWPEPREPLAFCAARLGLTKIAWAGLDPGPITQVALLPGSGGDFLVPAQQAGAKILLTGEINYHHALLAEELGFCVLAAGHFETEKPSLLRLGRELEKMTSRLGATIEYIYLSEQSPWRAMAL
jgi:dinuclear metal center YbgI/SA1388 family protein